MPETFDFSRYLTKIKGKDYLEVKWRLVWLRSEHPDARIETRILEHTETFALFFAVVTLPSGASATGHGSETKGDFGDFTEKAETKALGRALGALGYGTQFCDDFDFGAGAQEGKDKVVDSPFARRSTPPTPTSVPTAAELAKQAVARGLWDVAGVKSWCEARGVSKVSAAPERDRVQLAHDLANRLGRGTGAGH